ncbi:MAG: GtrA family protein [Clostridia bacterium]|nr:GtrA family protein [Clostridia bacterium]
MEQTNTKKEWMRSLKFFLFSISAGVIQIGSFTILELFISNYWLAYLPSLLLSIIWNFTINRKFTFKSANNVKIAMLLVLAFYAVFTPLSTWLGELAARAGAHEFLILAVTMIANFVLEYLYTRFVVYRNSCDTAVDKKKNADENSDIKKEKE